MSTPVTTHVEDTTPVRPSPLVKRVFGEPRFHTDGDIAAIAFSADGSLFSIDEAGVLRHWAQDGTQLARHFLSDLETLWCFSAGAKVLASGNDDLLLWDVKTGQLLRRIEQPSEQQSWVTAIAFSADGTTVVSGHDDGKLRFWDTAAYKFVGEIAAHPRKGIAAIAFSPNGEFVATAGEDLSVRVWDAETHKPVAELKSHTDRIPALTWSPDSTLLISAGWDTSARVWRPPQADPLMLLNSHADQVVTTAFSPDGKYLACADSDFDIHLWLDAVIAVRGPVLRGHNDEIRCLAFSPDGTKLASAGADRVVHVWDVRDGKLIAGPNPRGRHAIAVIPGSPLRLASSGAANVRVWDVESGDEVAPTNLCSAFSVAASPDGKWLGVGGTDYFTQLWDAADGHLAASLEATKPPVGFVTFSPDSKVLAHTSPADGLVWLWTCATGQPDMIIVEAADACTLETVAFHPNGKWIACGGVDYMSTCERDGAVCIWDVTTKEKLFTYDTGVTSLAFDPQGKYLAGAGLDDAVYVWDAETQHTVFVFGGHQQNINVVVFDPTGSYLLSGGDDGTVRAWDVLSGRHLVARAFDCPVQSLAFSPDGKYLFCGNSNTTCYQVEFKKFLEE
ncbi:WD domain, G-beta repeat [Gemmata sp. SH-PL17]|uniref:WD40 repeat domain-containing protein n=1 Tax=Gemmata sp. SH-PL17 TaxID=1630693 RepID=UPI00078E85C7|nr:WD40 repeat domain-containing protein [Gemmata sp. SH-PL17]AMV27973.1 WD domain, G-beta repeat [Gemmata sp. SH-PL17]